MRRRKKEIILLRSVTHAYRARDILEKKGVRAYIERIPEDLRQGGCGYGVAVYDSTQRAIELIEEAGIEVKRIVR